MRKVVIFAALAVSALVIAPLVGAAVKHPQEGSYATKAQRNGNTELSFNVQGGKVKGLGHYGKCDPLPIINFPQSLAIRNGVFKWSGKGTDPVGQKYQIALNGTFIKKNVATGSYKVKKLTAKKGFKPGAGCHQVENFRATLQPAQG